MTNEIQNLLIPLAQGENLTREQMQRAFQIMLMGGATPAQVGALLMGLRQKGETVEEITGAVEVVRSKCQPFPAPEDAIDTCGTGGDSKGTFNISTAAAIVAAACGVPVAKHGNRNVTSASGSSDVLHMLGVDIDVDAPVMERALAACNLCFLMAPRFHTAMRHVAPVRQELGLRTIFNFIGPLCNPARVKRQVMGVFSRKWVEPIAEVLKTLGAAHAWVVHGHGGMDELSLSGPSLVAELKEGNVKTFEISPRDAGLETAPVEALKVADAEHSAEAIRQVLADKPGPHRDVVLLNAAAALIVGGKAENIREGIELARAAIHWGKARDTLSELVRITTGVGE